MGVLHAPPRSVALLRAAAAAAAAAARAVAAPGAAAAAFYTPLHAPSSSSSSSSSTSSNNSWQQQRQHYATIQASKAPFSIPDAVKSAFENAPFAAALIPGAGRGLVATRPLERGEPILREAPLAAAPSVARRASHCYHCLAAVDAADAITVDAAAAAAAAATLPSGAGAECGAEGGGGPLRVPLPGGRGDAVFCGAGCLAEASGSFFAAELVASRAGSGGGALAALDADCRAAGERFPLLAARLAFALVQRHSGGGGGNSSEGTRREAAGQLPVDPLCKVGFLCHANVPPPPPAPWARAHAHLAAALGHLAAEAGGGSGGGGGAWNAAAAAEAARALDLGWFVAVMARLHLNTFRVDVVPPLLSFADLAAAASAAISGGGSSGGSGGGGGSAGSALYLTGSLFNHACEPNVDVSWPRNNAVAAFTAARDVAAGEQLTITYTDSSAPAATRRARLFEAYGFECGCALCREQLAGAGGGG